MAVKTPKWVGATSPVITPESGNFIAGERAQWRQVWEGTYASCKAAMKPRGYFGTALDGYGMLGWVVTNCELVSVRGARGKLTITWDPGGSDAWVALPCDDFNVETIELYPRIERHKLFNQTSTGSGSMADITLPMLSLCYASVHGHSAEARAAAYAQINGYADADQKDLGTVLVDKLRKGEETFYLAGFKYIWWYFSYALPSLSDGGVIQAPYGPGTVPTALPAGLSWLRLADSMSNAGVNGSMFKVTRTFLGGPAGHWDTDLYV
jgi:hypothetical protein